VSGIFGIALHNRRPFGDQFPWALAYNPFTKVPLPTRLIGVTQYWSGEWANNVWIPSRFIRWFVATPAKRAFELFYGLELSQVSCLDARVSEQRQRHCNDAVL
jgi:hypothetical protein